MRKSSISAVVVAASALAGPALAQTIIDTYPYWDNNITNGWARMAQSFIAPTDNVLETYTFGFDGSNVNIQVDVYEWDETVGEVGPSLYSTQVVGNPGDITLSNINLALNSGTRYALVFDFQGYSGPSIHYMLNDTGNPGGDASWWNGSWQYLNSGWNTKFRAEFSGGGRFTIRLSGSCPGPKTLSWSGAGSGQMGILIANGQGNYTIPVGPCSGTQLGLGSAGLTLYNIIGTQGGAGQVSQTVGTPACGKWVQCIKTNDCSTSNATGPI